MPNLKDIKDLELLQKMLNATHRQMKRINEGEKSSLDLGELMIEATKIEFRIEELTN
jgi:hypothetical protein